MAQPEKHWPPSTWEVLVLLQGDQLLSTTAIAWATTALVAGFDSPSLRTLAGLDLEGQVNAADATPLVEAALSQLGIARPSFEEAARQYLREVAKAIVCGDLAPRPAAELVHRRVVSPLNHPEDLMPWCYVWEGNASDCSRSLKPHEEDAEIIKVARQHLGEAV